MDSLQYQDPIQNDHSGEQQSGTPEASRLQQDPATSPASEEAGFPEQDPQAVPAEGSAAPTADEPTLEEVLARLNPDAEEDADQSIGAVRRPAEQVPASSAAEADSPVQTGMDQRMEDHTTAGETEISAEAREALQSWWATTLFPGKEYTELSENGTLLLRRANGVRPRPLGVLTPEKADATIKALSDKFPELEARVNELRTEWDRSEDKTKLQGKVHKLRDHLSNTIAIGDFLPLMVQLAFWDNHLEGLMKKADEKKESLVQQAEELSKRTDWKEASAAWRPLVDEWKAAGTAHRDTHEALWNRFEAARESFYESKRAANAETEKELLQNLDLKMEIVDKAEKLAATETWKKTTEAFNNLMEEWKTTGRTVADKQEALWQRFIAAKNVFFDRKRAHYEEIKVEQEGSLALKNAIVEEAEGLANSQEWNKAGLAFDALMERWKKSGRVPEEKGEALWKRFNAARDTFFGARRAHTEQKRVAFADNLARKSALVSRAEALQHSTQWRETTIEFSELMEEWKASGHVPKSEGDKLWEAFSSARRTFFDRKDADRDKRNAQFAKFREDKVVQQQRMVKTLEEELREEEDNLAGLHEGLSNLTGSGKKDAEIRAHLESLIPATEKSIQRKKEKIEKMRAEAAAGGDRSRREEGGRGERTERPRRDRGDRPRREDAGAEEAAPAAVTPGPPEQSDAPAAILPADAPEGEAPAAEDPGEQTAS